jgi:predicted DNA-binding protein|tara:strand:+ start:6275 stop:6502 length:228 start_codon:yes stop_codon:yes gene_type:complete
MKGRATMSKTHQVQIRMDADVFAKLKALADDNGLALATYIRSLLIQYTKGKLDTLEDDVVAKLAGITTTRPDVTF